MDEKSLLVKNPKGKIELLHHKGKTRDHLTLEDIYNQYDLIYYILNVSKLVTNTSFTDIT